MTGFLADVRYGLRALIRNFRLTLLAGIILGLAIGGSASIFAWIDAVFLRPLAGVSAPRQLVRFERVQPGLSATDFSYPDYQAYSNGSRSFSGLAAHCPAALRLSTAGTQRIRGDMVTGSYFSVLGVRPALGRLLTREDDGPLATMPVAVLSYGLWRRVFVSDSKILGKAAMLNGHPFTIVGVAAPEFTGTQVGQPIDLWIPLSMLSWGDPALSIVLNDRAAGWIDIFGRLKARVSLTQAQARLSAIAGRLANDFPVTNAHRKVRLISGIGIDPDDQQDLAKLLGLLLAAVAILLIAGGANIATLLLARALNRQQETALRLAIGATPSQIIRQLVVEALLLSSAAGALGVFLTPWISRLVGLFRTSSPVLRDIDPAFDWRLAVFIVFLITGTGILLGLAPALESRKIDLADSLKQASRTLSGRRPKKQQALVISQLALAFLLLTGTGLMLKTMCVLLSVNPGFDSRDVLLMSIDPGIQGYSESRGKQFYSALIDRVEALPGVRSASLTQTVPPQEWETRVSVFHPGQVPSPEIVRGREFEIGFRADANFISPHYFRTLAVPILAGRDFDKHDDQNAPAVAMVDSALAERMWPRQYAVGKLLVWPAFDGPPRPPMTVIGVVGNTRQRSLSLEPPMLLYLPVAQSYVPAMTLLVHSASTTASQIREQVFALDKSLPVFHIQTMREHVAGSLWRRRTALDMIGVFGPLSMIVAAIGLYGVVSQWVFQRTRDIGIRMALGASRAGVLKLVLRHACVLVLNGIAVGLIATFAAAYLGSSVFTDIAYGVKAADPTVLAIVALLLLCAALAAGLIPALRALRADPAAALRAE